ncbi:MAG: DNA glycosylase [Bacteroidota bacterium]
MRLIQIPKPAYFNFSECLWFLDRGYDDCMHQVLPDSVRKIIPTADGKHLIEVADNDNHLDVAILSGQATPGSEKKIKEFITQWFDVDRDLSGFYTLNAHQNTRWLTDPYEGLRLVMIPDFFEAICWSVIGQQINLTFAFSLKRKLVELCESPFEYDGYAHYSFPSAEKVANLDIQDLKSIQFSQRKAEYLIGIARLFVSGAISYEQVASLGDTESMVAELCQIRGIGQWSANYVLMKTFNRMDCITHGDTGLQAAVRKKMALDRKPTREEVIAFLQPFKGWESYVVFYLWRSLSF